MKSQGKIYCSLAALIVLVSLALTNTAYCEDRGGISGAVVDASGSVVVGARVKLLDSHEVLQQSVVTGSDGTFTFADLPNGGYTVLVEHRGFETAREETAISGRSAAPSLRITLLVATVRQTVDVTTAGMYVVPDALGATRTDTPIMETPVSIKVIPQQVMKDQQVVRLDEAVQNVSGVIPNNDSYGTNDSFSIRGFDAMEMTYEDGLRLDQYSNAGFPIDMANVERLEVVKGPASVMYGQAEPGGVVNIITKQPLDTSHYSLQQQFGSYDFYRTNFDATGPFSERICSIG